MSILFHGRRSPVIVAASGLAALTLVSVTSGLTPPAAPDAAPSARAALTAARGCQPGTSTTLCRRLGVRRRFLPTHV